MMHEKNSTEEGWYSMSPFLEQMISFKASKTLQSSDLYLSGLPLCFMISKYHVESQMSFMAEFGWFFEENQEERGGNRTDLGECAPTEWCFLNTGIVGLSPSMQHVISVHNGCHEKDVGMIRVAEE